MAGMAPEADLRSVSIGRRNNPARLTDLKPAFARSNAAEELFFTKGGASAESFRPPYRRYSDALENGSAVVAFRPAAVGEAKADGELSPLERAFIESHQRALTEGPGPEPEGEDTRPQDTAAAAPERIDACPPMADLRTVLLRRNPRDTARVDELFLTKDRGGERGIEEPPEAIDEPSVMAPADQPSPVHEDSLPPPPVGPAEINDDAAAAEHDAPIAAIRRAPPPAAAGKARSPLLTPLQIAIIVFGCVATLASAGVVFPIYVPLNVPPPRVELVVPPSTPQVAAPARPPVVSAVEDLLARGDERLGSGDVATARLFYEKAASAGSARGALMTGATYDPNFLSTIGVYGVPGDDKAAAIWYRRAADLGDVAAAGLGKTVGK
jgi:hypothetical protein